MRYITNPPDVVPPDLSNRILEEAILEAIAPLEDRIQALEKYLGVEFREEPRYIKKEEKNEQICNYSSGD